MGSPFSGAFLPHDWPVVNLETSEAGWDMDNWIDG
jgi:hypothetical protein